MSPRALEESRNVETLERLLTTAESIAGNWQLFSFRERGASIATRGQRPSETQIGSARAIMVGALHACMKALAEARSVDSRRHVAAAMIRLIAAVRAEPAPKPAAHSARNYWMDDR